MKGPREIKRWVNRLRRRYGKGNGVVSVGAFDSPEHERKLAKSFKQRSRCRSRHERRFWKTLADANNKSPHNKGERAA